ARDGVGSRMTTATNETNNEHQRDGATVTTANFDEGVEVDDPYGVVVVEMGDREHRAAACVPLSHHTVKRRNGKVTTATKDDWRDGLYRSGLKPPTLLCGQMIAQRADPDGTGAYPSFARLGVQCGGKSTRTIQTYVKELVIAGWLRKV